MTPFRPEDEDSALLNAIVDASDDAIISTNVEGVIRFWNRAAERFFGYTAEDVTGHSVSLILPLHRRDEITTVLSRIKAGERVEHLETVRQAKDGRLVDVSLTVVPIRNRAGSIVGATAVARDLTARKRSDVALRASESRWQSIVDSAVDGIIVIDGKGRIEAFNRGAERLFGYRALEVLGRNVNMLMPSPYSGEHDEYLARYLATGAAKVIGIGREVVGRRRDGTTFPLHLSVGEMSIDGEPKFTGMLHDLTERVQLEERIRASEARWRSVIESAVDGIVIIDARGRIEAFNPAAERLFGYTADEVVGRNINMLMPSPYHEEHDGYLARYLETGVPKIIGTGREVTALRKDGTTFPIHLSVGEMAIGDERKFTGIIHDLSARVRIEEQLREHTALARLGEMAAVIAHEVKNPLAGVRGAIQVIGMRLPKDSKDGPIVKEIVARIDALNSLMQDLLLFARTPQPKRAPVDLAALVAQIADLLSRDPARKEIEVAVGGSAPLVEADADLLKIVFENLLVNGAQAMQGRGTIRVSLSSTDDACQIAFSDSGPGIPANMRERIFTPFFTTKARGSGLGLPTAKRLIEAHGGHISIVCPPAGGTTVTVELPAHDEASTASQP